MERSQLIVYVLTTIMVLAVGWGFYNGGSPSDAQSAQFDEKRSGDLSEIQRQIGSYYTKNKNLPSSLNDLPVDKFIPSRGITDPQTKKGYDYKTKTDTSYELCANFGSDTLDKRGSSRFSAPTYPDFYSHGKGKYCFD